MPDNNGSANTSGASTIPKAVPRGILARSGLPLPAGARLNSGLRAPRDLTLGGIPISKKTVAPNLTPNIHRKTTSTNVAQSSNARDQRGGSHQRGNRGRGSDRSRGRGKGRGRGTQNLIQLDGIFGSSPAGSNERSHWSSSSGGGGRSAEASVKETSLPKYIPINQDDSEDTEETINRVTKAEFIDYGDNTAGEFPLMLPLSTVNHFEQCGTEDFKVENPMDVDSNATGKMITTAKEEENPLKVAEKLLKSLCLGEASTKEEEEGKTLTVFQLPRLPGPSQAYKRNERKHPNQIDGQAGSQQYKLKNLPKGSFGKLQVLRDGRVRLVSGRVTMELQMAADLPIYQEVVDVHGRMVVPVAKVDKKVVCRLNPTDLFKS